MIDKSKSYEEKKDFIMTNSRNIGKARLLLESFLVYGVGGVINKFIPLIMLPVITRMLPDTTYFGISDLSNTLVSFGGALAVIGMYDAMYRMFFEKNEEHYKKKVCSTTMLFTFGMSVIVTLLMISGQDMIARLFFGDPKYSYLVYISAVATLVSATNSIIAAPTRMQNKKKEFLIINTISPIISYSVSIPLILKGYYIIALPLAALVSGAVTGVLFFILNKKWFNLLLFDKKLLAQLLAIAIPLFPNFVIYWIFNSSDKLMITNLLGMSEAGIYSAGSKLGTLSQLIYTAFAGGWQFFAFSTMKEKNQVETNSRIFEYLGVISFVASVFVFALSRLAFQIIFPNEYLTGYIVAPYLFMAPLMQMLFQVACNQFLVIKKTWPNMFILLGGAVINVFLNIILIPAIGIEGAAIATLTGYVSSVIIVGIVLCRMKLMYISNRFVVSICCMLLYVILWRFVTISNTILSLIVALIFVVVMLNLYKKEFALMMQKVRKTE